jgi:hypothetical protein
VKFKQEGWRNIFTGIPVPDDVLENLHGRLVWNPEQ